MSESIAPVLCDGPCKKEGRTLYPVEVNGGETELWCMECSADLAEKESARRSKEDLVEYRESLLQNSGLPKRLHGVSFDDFITDRKVLKKFENSGQKLSDKHIKSIGQMKDKAHQVIEGVLAKEPVMIVLAGGMGTGKTLFEGMVMNALMEASHKCQFFHAKQLLSHLIDFENYQRVIAEMAYNSLVCIDDLTHVPETEFTIRAISDIVNTLYMEEKSLIISTNYIDHGTIKNYIGEGSYDRLHENPIGGIWQCQWPSFRGARY